MSEQAMESAAPVKEEPLFVNVTKNDLETNVQAGKEIARKTRTILCGVMCPIIILLGVALLLLEIFAESTDRDFTFAIAIMVMGAVIFIYMTFFYSMTVRAITRKMMQGKEATVQYSFTEEGYEILTTTNAGITDTARGSFTAFAECRETKGFWLLFYNKATMFILRKDGMQKGSPEEFSSFLHRKFGVKYSVKYKKK